MVNVRCQACQAKYRLLAAKRVNLLGLALEARPVNRKANVNQQSDDDSILSLNIKPAPRFPYRPPIQRRPRSYILPPVPYQKTKKCPGNQNRLMTPSLAVGQSSLLTADDDYLLNASSSRADLTRIT